MREQPVEGLLTCVAGRADDRRLKTFLLKTIQTNENYAVRIVIRAPGRRRASRESSRPRSRLTQPFVGRPVLTCRKIAEPRPGTGVAVLYSTTAKAW